jgi:hypothetical protein
MEIINLIVQKGFVHGKISNEPARMPPKPSGQHARPGSNAL